MIYKTHSQPTLSLSLSLYIFYRDIYISYIYMQIKDICKCIRPYSTINHNLIEQNNNPQCCDHTEEVHTCAT